MPSKINMLSIISTLKKDYIANHRRKKALYILFIYRLGNLIHYSILPKLIKKPILIFLKIFYQIFIQIPFQIEIPFAAKIGYAMRISHYNGIIISEHANIGNNCSLFQQVTIGVKEGVGISHLAPKIGNNVYIGCGAKIIGNVCIGDNVKIGANAVVVKNVSDNAIVYTSSDIKIKQ